MDFDANMEREQGLRRKLFDTSEQNNEEMMHEDNGDASSHAQEKGGHVPLHVQVMEELKKQKKLHNQVVEELLRQEQEQQQVSRRLQQRQRTKSTPNINRSNMITIILAGLVVVLMFYQFYSNRKYQKVIDTIAQQDITVNGGQGETLAGMEKRLTTVENKVDEILSQFQFNIEPVDVGESTGQDTSAVTTDGQPKYKKYIVQKGDTLWSISQKFYGTGQKSEELMEINGFTNPNDLKAGTTILVPANR